MKKLKILIVEDEILIAELIKDYLTEKGHDVSGTAISYEEALQSFNLRRPDLILLDIRLYGEKSGIDFAQYLASVGETTPVIYLSSQYDQRTLSHALNTHPFGYLTKPIRKETLWTSIESAYNLAFTYKSEPVTLELFDGKSYHSFRVEDFLYAVADHVYVRVYLVNEEEIVARMTLKDLEQLLGSNSIWRCHRSYLVSTSHIKNRFPDNVFMINGKTIPVSRSRKK